MRLPAGLAATWRDEEAWLAALPDLAAACAATWGLALEEPLPTPRSLVVPAGDVVLKLNAPGHADADHEADALAAWDGQGAARLVARDDERRALLLERCRPGTTLATTSPEAPELVARLVGEVAEGLSGGRSPVRARASRPSPRGLRRRRPRRDTARQPGSPRLERPRG